MQCCVPFCDNTSDIVTTSDKKEIGFHGFPSEVTLHTAWLEALGMRDPPQPGPGVVCSQHFLDDDFYTTEGGARMIRSDAIPSTVLICMMCLDTDSKLVLMGKLKLEQIYELLTGRALWNSGNLRRALCAACAQRLLSFSRFRDTSLRACSLLVQLLEKHPIITLEHIKMIDLTTKNNFKSNFESITLEPDNCDLYDIEQIKKEPIDVAAGIKDKNICDFTHIDENFERKEIEEDSINNEIDETKEDTFTHIDESIEVKIEVSNDESNESKEVYSIYLTHIDENLEQEVEEDNANNEVDESSSTHINENIEVKIEVADNEINESNEESSAHIDESFEVEMDDNSNNEVDKTNEGVTSEQTAKLMNPVKCAFICYYCFEEFVREDAYHDHMSLHIQNTGVDSLQVRESSSSGSRNLKNKKGMQRRNAGPLQTSQLPHTQISAAAKQSDAIQKNEQTYEVNIEDVNNLSQSDNKTRIYIQRLTKCDKLLDNSKKNRKSVREKNIHMSTDTATSDNVQSNHTMTLDNVQMSTQTAKLQYSCQICDYKSTKRSNLTQHMVVHTGEKPYCCDTCNYKCARKCDLIKHVRIHTGDKPYICELCDYRSAHRSNINQHMKVHANELHYCDKCNYKAVLLENLIAHMRIHTVEKPYSCNMCSYKCAQMGKLRTHMKIHADKPFVCDICDYKSAKRSNLFIHMNTHTGDKPFSCELCDYKTAQKGNLVIHMRIHNNEKPYSCDVCNYRSAGKSQLHRHMKTHSADKPYCCEICDHRFARKCYLIGHMRSHTGDKPYFCEICNYKSTRKWDLFRHMKKHANVKS